jgi:hypothetical protein
MPKSKLEILAMKEQLLEVIDERHKRIQCIYRCVNLNLEVIKFTLQSALKGNNDIYEKIHKISDLASSAFGSNDDKFERYHSFVVSHYFITLISEFEGFLVDFLRVVVKNHPPKIGNISLKLSEVAECENLDQVIEIGVNKFLNDLVYKKPRDYVEAINDILSTNQSSELDDLWRKFIELKARRDLGVHNDWKSNETYFRKVTEIGGTPSKGEFLAPDNDYFVEAVQVVHDLMNKLGAHCVEKFTSDA